jgi:hypothetical protein
MSLNLNNRILSLCSPYNENINNIIYNNSYVTMFYYNDTSASIKSRTIYVDENYNIL